MFIILPLFWKSKFENITSFQAVIAPSHFWLYFLPLPKSAQGETSKNTQMQYSVIIITVLKSRCMEASE